MKFLVQFLAKGTGGIGNPLSAQKDCSNTTLKLAFSDQTYSIKKKRACVEINGIYSLAFKCEKCLIIP